jgi:hypothetical protein
LFDLPISEFGLPSNIDCFNQKCYESKIEKLQYFIASIDKKFILKSIGRKGETRLDIYSINPGILILNDFQRIPMKVPLRKAYKISFSDCFFSKNFPFKNRVLVMLWNGTIFTPVYKLEKGDYELIVNAKGTSALNQYAKLSIKIFSNDKNCKKILLNQIIELRKFFSTYKINFSLDKSRPVSFEISFFNDFYDKKAKKDRNVFIESIELKRF